MLDCNSLWLQRYVYPTLSPVERMRGVCAHQYNVVGPGPLIVFRAARTRFLRFDTYNEEELVTTSDFLCPTHILQVGLPCHGP